VERDRRVDLSTGAGSDLRRVALISPASDRGAESRRDADGDGAGRCFAAGPPPLSLYVHLPWCVRKCPYCDFNSHVAGQQIPERRYLDALLEDLEVQLGRASAERLLRSVFIGGGTPSLFSGAAIARLLDGIRHHCRLAADVEITLEANPGAVDAGHFDAYLRAGVNRLSIGVQSLSAPHLSALGRIHDPAQALAAHAAARRAGFGNINLDMMFGLPRQSVVQARDDLARLIDLQPEHISYYQLTLEPNTAFAHSPPPVAKDDQLCDMQEQGMVLLAAAGYRRYEVSAYARPECRCRHNLNYWRFGDYIGIGAGAHGKLTNTASGTVERRICRRHPDAYMGMASGTDSRVSSRFLLTNDDLVLEFALNALRLVDGVEARLFEHHTGLALKCLDAVLVQARNDGLLLVEAGLIRPSELGLRFLNLLVERFDLAGF
jgi:putative oxygen-independent coproporphyrinogen III oxidase